MLVIPAIDLKDGRCVRLRQGDLGQETVYSDDPSAMARRWQNEGATMLHIVDLNGAIEGEPKNQAHIEAILEAVSVPVQIGGGIRTLEAIKRYLSRGAERVILGTAALQDREVIEWACSEFPGRIWVGMDARNGHVAVRGWTTQTETSVVELLEMLKGHALGGVVYTDIARDGMLGGPNLTALRRVVDASTMPVIASGGVTRVEDILAIKALGPRIEGVIVGKALYDRKLQLKDAVRAGQ
jgi:phosphoribosylformimino-5-aminoimidazole carboxamide ribotide isomerase